ncbi:sigma-54-dependent transcriptional regulator [Bowmanella dokdonensis]|uniref:Sigma-54-dependent Fis family transcriptional regulator n=1 Tax=Bowmanella dokdonensis TaxID=751969 RepID=A0A939DNH8_9ALTE|nr:sigma-54 dependent transcriptional regulator [Bowmanella dokdonensis]MBN7825845.1 sigma-54-dependent Fis family transcriptional regulator [Bowmanella dokdonensis]
MGATKGLILVADDDQDIRLALKMLLENEGYQTIEAASQKDIAVVLSRQQPDLVLLDMNFSRDTTSGEEGLTQLRHLTELGIRTVLMTAWGSVELAVKGMQEGAADFIEKPWDKHRLLQILEQQCKIRDLAVQNQTFRAMLNSPEEDWIANSSSMRALESLVRQVAPTRANILILGENGTGKSVLARRIHRLSSRSQHAFISVNMGAIPANLFESELFGHRKGAFTDARESRVGRFELANGGTLFMDEVGTLPPEVQPKLLRVLETGEYEMVGASQTQQSDARIISATNADLQKLVGEGRFRQDLLFRLNTFVLELPALRQRRDDIADLADLFCRRFCRQYGKELAIADSTLDLLLDYDWPGNIRELSHIIERAVLICQHKLITAEHLLLPQQASMQASSLPSRTLDEVEQEMIQSALSRCRGRISQAAQALGISRNALYRRMEKFGLDKREFSDD